MKKKLLITDVLINSFHIIVGQNIGIGIANMKRIFILFLLLPNILFSQNVGVGTTTPQEKLDVNGNINVSGTIKANGIAGQPGQIMTINSAGKIQWDNNSTGTDLGYKNFVGFYAIFDSIETWTVPAGVNRILIEAWAGGGGGSLSGGGGGGGYVRAQFGVNAGAVITIAIGKGGVGSSIETNPGQSGANTIVTVPDSSGMIWLAAATGGIGAYTNPGSNFLSTHNNGGSYFVIDQSQVLVYPNFMGAPGEPGYPSYYTYTQSATGTFQQEATCGRGGDAGNSIKTGGAGGRSFLMSKYDGFMGVFGGGGGSGMPGFSGGKNGGKGKVLIWY